MMQTSDMMPELLELPIGIDWQEQWTIADTDLQPYDITGCSYRLEIREKTGAMVTEAAVEHADQDEYPAEILLALTAEQIGAMEARVLHWVLIETNGTGKEEPLAFGPVITRDIT